MATSIADVPFDRIRSGLKLISVIGTQGIVESFDPNFVGDFPGYLVIQWSNGNRTFGEPGRMPTVVLDPSEEV